jgi:cupin fold WbuC family metalloprotein
MLKYYSKIDKSKILFSLLKKTSISNNRNDICPDNQFLQVSAKKIHKGDFFKAHRHLACDKQVTITQECWIILDGEVEGIFYDIDNKEIFKTTLKSGDCIAIFNGGHSLECLSDNTILYEIKNGPYFGAAKDKVYLEDLK